ncbi:MAG: hypothetical protein AAF548_10240 [Actinomycetota bacterium]
MNIALWIWVAVVALGAYTAIRARRDGQYSWALGVGITALLLPPLGAVLAYTYLVIIRKRLDIE